MGIMTDMPTKDCFDESVSERGRSAEGMDAWMDGWTVCLALGKLLFLSLSEETKTVKITNVTAYQLLSEYENRYE